METMCGRPTEDIDPNAPSPKGNVVHTTAFVDANLMHDTFLDQTPIDWFWQASGPSRDMRAGNWMCCRPVAHFAIVWVSV